jgi:uncharacterized protein YllA (UPF0747 family)
MRLEPVEDGYRVKGSHDTITTEEVLAMCDEAPERFSPNVGLRPIVQDAVLPTAAYLGGPSEIAYLMQLEGAYARFGIAQPLIAPRPFVALLEPPVLRALRKSDVDLDTILDSSFDIESHFIDSNEQDRLDALMGKGDETIAQAFDELKETTSSIDPTLEKARDAARHKASKELENFVGRLLGALKRRNETEINRVAKALQLVLPDGSLQERQLGSLYYLNKYGLDAFRTVLEAIEFDSDALQCIEL